LKLEIINKMIAIAKSLKSKCFFRHPSRCFSKISKDDTEFFKDNISKGVEMDENVDSSAVF